MGYFLTGRSQASRAREIGTTPRGDLVVADTAGGPADLLRHDTATARRGDLAGDRQRSIWMPELTAPGTGVMITTYDGTSGTLWTRHCGSQPSPWNPTSRAKP